MFNIYTPLCKDRHHHHRSHRDGHGSHRSSHKKRYNVGVQCKIGEKSKNQAHSSSSTSGSGVAGTGPDRGVAAANNRKYAGFSLANPCPSLEGNVKYKYGHLMRIETYPNGGGEVLHMWHDEIRHLSDAEQVNILRKREKFHFLTRPSWP